MVDKKALFDALAQRVPFRTARRMLVAADFPTGLGWDAVHEKLKDKSAAAKADYDKLNTLYIESLAASEKSVRVFELPTVQANALSAGLANRLAADSNSPAASSYPYPMPLRSLDKLTSANPTVAGMVAVPNGKAYILSSYNEIRSRVQISTSQLRAAPGITYQEAYAIQVARRQTFDCIFLPTSGKRIYVLLDSPDGITSDLIVGGFSRIREFAKSVTGADILANPVNLFPAIKPLYDDGTSKLLAYDHASTDSSMRRERVRGSSISLRDAKFHKAAMAGVNGNTDAFGITVCWDVDSVGRIDAKPELEILGPYHLLHELNPVINEGHIGKCGAFAEAAFVIAALSKILDSV